MPLYDPNQLLNYPQINPESLEKLRRSTASQPQLLKDIFVSYISDTQELLEEMQACVDANNSKDYFGAVHSLKGLAGTIGCTRMFQLLKLMDSLKKEKDFQDSTLMLPALTEVFLGLEKEIRETIL